MTDQTPSPADAGGEAADIVERLLEPEYLHGVPRKVKICVEAADEITRLRAREAELLACIDERLKAEERLVDLGHDYCSQIEELGNEVTRLQGGNEVLLRENKRLKALADDHFRNSERLAKRNAELQRKLDEAANHARILLNENSEVLTSIVEHHVRAIASIRQPAGADSQGEG